MAKGNGQDRGAVRAELARRLMRLAPRPRLDALIESADAKGLVRAVPAEDLYLAIADVGLQDAAEVVQLASPEQFRTCVDLGGWKASALDPHGLLAWLRAARGEDSEEFLKKVHGLDLEVLELLLRSFTEIHDLEETPDVNPSGVTMEMPEGKYLIEFKVEGVEQASVRALLNDLIAENPFEAGRLVEAIRWELTSELEEAALQFRAARLADLGFPPLYEALALFTYVDPAKWAPAAPSTSTEALEAPSRVDFLDAGLSGLDPGEAEALGQELRYLVNCALVAEGAEPGDPAALRRTGELARHYLGLGLEQASGGNPSKAAEVLREHEARKLFQLGFSLTLALKHRVDRLAKEKGAKLDGVWMALSAEAAALEALGRKRPLKALKVEGAEPVPFSSRKELAEAQALLDRVERQKEIFAALLPGGSAEVASRFGAPLSQVGPERIFSAAAANCILDQVAKAAPVPPERLVELCERLFEGEPSAPSLRAGAIERATAAVAAAVTEAARPEVRGMVERVLARLLEELGAPYLSGGRVEPKTVIALPLSGQPVL